MGPIGKPEMDTARLVHSANRADIWEVTCRTIGVQSVAKRAPIGTLKAYFDTYQITHFTGSSLHLLISRPRKISRYDNLIRKIENPFLGDPQITRFQTNRTALLSNIGNTENSMKGGNCW